MGRVLALGGGQRGHMTTHVVSRCDGAADGKRDSRIAAAQISPVVGYHLSVWKAVNGDDSPI
jgi:hypothetical protein